MVKTLKIQTTSEIIVPAGTKIIRNDEWLTLCRKLGGEIHLFTCPIESMNDYTLTDESNWMKFSKWELEAVVGK